MTATRPARLGALDLLRGITVAAMIVVNNPGNWDAVFPQLVHAPWNGATFADLIFPTFIFIMGTAMALGLPLPEAQAERSAVYRRVVWRAVLLVAMGLALNAAAAWPHPGAARIPGVLQRIGATYLVAAGFALSARDRPLLVIVSGLLLLHWAVLVIPFGANTATSLAPGENIAAIVDRALFGTHTLTSTGDPEGALGLLSSVATALLGVAVGRWLRRRSSTPLTAVPGLALAGAAALAVAYAWSFLLPFNKSLWTGSFALLGAGAAVLSLAACMLLERPGRSLVLEPLMWLGTNPLAVYFLSELLANALQRPWLTVGGHLVAPKDYVYWSVIVRHLGYGGGVGSSVVYALGYTLLWIGVAGVMKSRGVRVRV